MLRSKLGIAGVFVLGMIIGALLSAYFLRPPFPPPGPGSKMVRHHLLQHLSRELNLSAKQRVDLEPVVQDLQKRIVALHRSAQPEIESAIDEAVQRALPMLDKEQQTRLHSFRERARERASKVLGEE